MRQYFNLNKPYEFDINDIIAFIFTLSAALGLAGVNVTPLFLVGSGLGIIASVPCRKINLLILNGSLFILNAINFVKLFY